MSNEVDVADVVTGVFCGRYRLTRRARTRSRASPAHIRRERTGK